MTHQNRSKKKWSSIRSYLKAAHTSQYAKYHLPFKRSEWKVSVSLCTDWPCSVYLQQDCFTWAVWRKTCHGAALAPACAFTVSCSRLPYLFMSSSTFGLGWVLTSSGIDKETRAKTVYPHDMPKCLSLKAWPHGNIGNPLTVLERCFALCLSGV